MNDATVEIEDDIILDVFDIMSQSYLNIDEEEIEEDIILDVVDIMSHIYWENTGKTNQSKNLWIDFCSPMILYIYYIIY